MEYLPESTRLLYSQLLSQCLHAAAPNGRGISFVQKTIKGSRQWYLQLTIGSRKSQHYLGPDSNELQQLIDKEKQLWEKARPDRIQREKLVAMLIAGDAQTVSSAEARVLEILERTGVFLAGSVLIDSHAFTAFSNMLGIHWQSESMQTHDLDIAGDNHISVGLSSRSVDLKQALLDADMGFIEVPGLNRKAPSTRFRIQGKQLSVDILTPMSGKPDSKPVFIQSLNTYAEPLRFLDFLLEDTQQAIIIAKAGILVNVPAPARFALHKLVTAVRRPPTMQTKYLKDISQAAQLLDVLLDDRPGDIQLAFSATQKMPDKFRNQLVEGINRLPDELASEIKSYLLTRHK